jgi:serine/threonine-protein kinase
MSLFAELKRRNVFRAAAFYAASAWLLVQVATQVFPFFDVPNWVVRWFVIAAMIGFPFAIAVSWFYELTPEGFKREGDVEVTDSIRYSTGRKLEFAIIGVLSLAVVLLLADRLVLHGEPEAGDSAPGKSIAILPLRDLSPNHDQGYFSDGMSEELLNALAQVKDLKVAGRASSFHFRDAGENLATVGKTLGVANVLEGSVRKQDQRVRIAARLVQVADGRELWSHEYDGDLSDVF